MFADRTDAVSLLASASSSCVYRNNYIYVEAYATLLIWCYGACLICTRVRAFSLFLPDARANLFLAADNMSHRQSSANSVGWGNEMWTVHMTTPFQPNELKQMNACMWDRELCMISAHSKGIFVLKHFIFISLLRFNQFIPPCSILVGSPYIDEEYWIFCKLNVL